MKKTKNDFEKDFFKLMHNAVFRKTMENVRKHRDIKHVTTERRKYCEKLKLCYMDTDSFIVYIRTVQIYKDITKDVVTRFDTSNYELDRPSPKGKKTK